MISFLEILKNFNNNSKSWQRYKMPFLVIKTIKTQYNDNDNGSILVFHKHLKTFDYKSNFYKHYLLTLKKTT